MAGNTPPPPPATPSPGTPLLRRLATRVAFAAVLCLLLSGTAVVVVRALPITLDNARIGIFQRGKLVAAAVEDGKYALLAGTSDVISCSAISGLSGTSKVEEVYGSVVRPADGKVLALVSFEGKAGQRYLVDIAASGASCTGLGAYDEATLGLAVDGITLAADGEIYGKVSTPSGTEMYRYYLQPLESTGDSQPQVEVSARKLSVVKGVTDESRVIIGADYARNRLLLFVSTTPAGAGAVIVSVNGETGAEIDRVATEQTQLQFLAVQYSGTQTANVNAIGGVRSRATVLVGSLTPPAPAPATPPPVLTCEYCSCVAEVEVDEPDVVEPEHGRKMKPEEVDPRCSAFCKESCVDWCKNCGCGPKEEENNTGKKRTLLDIAGDGPVAPESECETCNANGCENCYKCHTGKDKNDYMCNRKTGGCHCEYFNLDSDLDTLVAGHITDPDTSYCFVSDGACKKCRQWGDVCEYCACPEPEVAPGKKLDPLECNECAACDGSRLNCKSSFAPEGSRCESCTPPPGKHLDIQGARGRNASRSAAGKKQATHSRPLQSQQKQQATTLAAGEAAAPAVASMLDINLETGATIKDYGSWTGTVAGNSAISLDDDEIGSPLSFVFLDETLVIDGGDGVTASDAYVLPIGAEGFAGIPRQPLGGALGQWEDPKTTGLAVGTPGSFVESYTLSADKSELRLVFNEALEAGTLIQPLRMNAGLTIGGTVVHLSKDTQLFANEPVTQEEAVATFEVKSKSAGSETFTPVAAGGTLSADENEITVSVSGFVSAGSAVTYRLLVTATSDSGVVTTTRALASGTNAVVTATLRPWMPESVTVVFSVEAVDVFDTTLSGCTKCQSGSYTLPGATEEALGEELDELLECLSTSSCTLEESLQAVTLLDTIGASREKVAEGVKGAFAAIGKFENGPQIIEIITAIASFLASLETDPDALKAGGVLDVITPEGIQGLLSALAEVSEKNVNAQESKKISVALNLLLAQVNQATCTAIQQGATATTSSKSSKSSKAEGKTKQQKFTTEALTTTQDAQRTALEAIEIAYEERQWTGVGVGGDIVDSTSTPVGAGSTCVRRVCRRIFTQSDFDAAPAGVATSCAGLMRLVNMQVPSGVSRVGVSFVQYSGTCAFDQAVLHLPTPVDNGPSISGGWQTLLMFDVSDITLPTQTADLLSSSQLSDMGGHFEVQVPAPRYFSTCVQRETNEGDSEDIDAYLATGGFCSGGQEGCFCRGENVRGPGGAGIAWVSTRTTVVPSAPVQVIPRPPSPILQAAPAIENMQGTAVKKDDDKGVRLGIGLGVGIGVPLVILILACCLCCLLLHRRRRASGHEEEVAHVAFADPVMVAKPGPQPAYYNPYEPAMYAPPPSPMYPVHA